MPDNVHGSPEGSLPLKPVEQVPHSGVHGYEQPPHEFDVSLTEAINSNSVHHVELGPDGVPIVTLPDTLGEYSDPVNSLRTEAYEPLRHIDAEPSNNKGKRRIAAIAAGAVGTALIGGLGFMMKGSNNEGTSPQPRTENSVSAGAEPGQSPDSPEIIPAPSAELAASVELYPTAAEAIVPLQARIDEYKNFYGTVDNLISVPLSEEQKAEHEEMLRSVFGSNLDNPPTPQLASLITNLREAWPEIMGYKSLTQQSIEGGYDSALFELTGTAENIQPIGDSQVRFTLVSDANFEENGIDQNMSPEYAASIEEPLTVLATLELSGGGWYISNWETS